MNAALKDTKPVIDAIVKTLHPLSIILFGSLAKQGVGRDMDLLIVTADKQEDSLKLNLLLHKPLERFYNKFAIDPFIISHTLLNEYYKKGSPFVKLICREGMLLDKGWALEKLHSIERLVAITKDYKVRLTLSEEEVVFIDSIYRGRYSAEAGLLPYGEPSKIDAQKVIRISKRIYKTVPSPFKIAEILKKVK